MSKKNDQTMYSMPRSKLLGYVKKAEQQINLLRWLIEYQTAQEMEHKWLLSNLCDSYSVNYKLIYELGAMIELNTDKKNGEVLMSKEDISIVEAIIIARHYANRELTLLGQTSISIH